MRRKDLQALSKEIRQPARKPLLFISKLLITGQTRTSIMLHQVYPRDQRQPGTITTTNLLSMRAERRQSRPPSQIAPLNRASTTSSSGIRSRCKCTAREQQNLPRPLSLRQPGDLQAPSSSRINSLSEHYSLSLLSFKRSKYC